MSDSSWQQIECGTGRWWIEPGWPDRLLSRGQLPLAEWEKQGRVEVVKDSVHRTIYRVDLPHRSVFIKRYPERTWLGRLRQRLRPAKAWNEWQLAKILKDRAIPTITPVAIGVYPNGESYLVSEEIDEAVQLYGYVRQHWMAWQNSGKFEDCRALAQELGIFLARMHRAGIAHRDLHPWNVLIRGHGQRREWFLIDPCEIKLIGRSAHQREKHLLKSFMLMSLALWPLSTLKDRLCCWRAFRQACPEWQPTKSRERKLLLRFDREVWRNSFISWKSRSRRCLQTNREFYQVCGQQSQAWVSREIPEDWTQRLLNNPDAPFHDERTKVLKTSRHAQVALIPGPHGWLIYKKFVPRGKLDAWLSLWRESPALRCYRMAYRLGLAYLPTAKPMAAIETRSKGRVAASYLLTSYLSDAVDLPAFFTRHKSVPSTCRAIVQQVVELVQRLHRYRLSHRDMKAVNFLIDNPESKTPKVYLIDLRGVHSQRWLWRSRRVKDLTRLALSAVILLRLSRTELLRGLCSYLGKEQSQWRWWWKQISLQMQKKIKQNTGRNRVLS